MSSPMTKQRRKKQKGRARAPHQQPTQARAEISVRTLLMMAVDAAGGTVRLSKEHARRIATIPMTLSIRELSAEEGGGTLLQLAERKLEHAISSPAS